LISSSLESIEARLRSADTLECGTENAPLEYVLKNKMLPDDAVCGVCVELGVASGNSITLIANYLANSQSIYGFDSFEGLPESWYDGCNNYQVGAFSTGGMLPTVPSNVTLIKGWFNETLPKFKEQVLKDKPINFS